VFFLERLLKKFKEYKRLKKLKLLHKKCMAKDNLTDWEKTFLKSLGGKTSLTEKQLSKLTEISIKTGPLRGKPVYSITYEDSWYSEENTDPRFCEKQGVSWGDIHDFDRD
jgi:hypothetical protein